MADMDPVVPVGDLGPPDPDLVPCAPPEDEQPEAGPEFTAARSSTRPLAGLVDALKKWHVNYRLVEGYETRGRPGAFAPAGVQWHHTASTSSPANPRPSLRTLVEGRPDLNGPLCQLAPDYEGIVWVVALGRANHAGLARAHGALPAGDGNTMRVGFEVQTSGTQRMPQAQLDATIRATVAVLDLLGVMPSEVPGYVCRHYDTSTTGKWDIGRGDGAYAPLDIRPHVKTITGLLAAGPQEDDDMAMTAAERKAFVDDLALAAWAAPITDIVPYAPGGKDNPTIRPVSALSFLIQSSLRQEAQQAALVAALQAVAARPDLSLADIEAAAKAGATAALDERITDSDVTLQVAGG